jgi:hypothetical protein
MRALAPLLSCLALLLCLPADAEAKRRHHYARRPPPPPVVRVVVKPAPRPAPRQHCPGPDTVWVAGHPGRGGVWVPGHCERVGPSPRAGWVYVSGYWNGRIWVSGFWRPQARVGFAWVDGHVNDADEYVAGYWEPEGLAPDGMIWRPGYFDGSDWVPGGWVPSESYRVYGEDGELAFFAVGDGHVEELAIPAMDATEPSLSGGGAGAEAEDAADTELVVPAQDPVPEGTPVETLERHAGAPD